MTQSSASDDAPVPGERAGSSLAPRPGRRPPTLQGRLKPRRSRAAEAEESVHLDEPVALFHDLEASRRFHRDTGLGRIFRPGSVSFRENVRNNSLHITIADNRVSAHVDQVSPLGLRPERTSRYALTRIAQHNVAGVAADLGRLLRGRQGDHRCELDCEWAPPAGEGAGTDQSMPLVDPATSPWSVHVEARVGGHFDEDRLRAALLAVAPGMDTLTVAGCRDDACVDAARVELLALAVPLEPPPLRARLVHHEGGDVLMLNLNHAAADGPGALQVLRAVARAYESGTEAVEPLEFLAARDLPVRPASSRPRSVAQRYSIALEKVRDLFARPARFQPEGPQDASGHGFHMVTVDSDDPASLNVVRNADADNDVLLAALHLAISVWNADNGVRDGRISVLVPIDLRTHSWQNALGNFSVTARVSTSPAQRQRPAAALEAVVSQTARNIRSRTGTALIDALDRNGLLPLWARQSAVVLQPLTANHLLDSAVLAYVGRADAPVSFGNEAGDATEVWLSIPARMPLGLSVGAVVISRRLHLTFRYPHRLFGPDAARRFAECFLAQIRLVASASPDPA